MLLLALDTSTHQASVALCSEDELLGEYSWRIGNNHSVELLDRIQRLFAECHRAVQEIDGVAVATGPGSFTGLRVAMATAKALAFALQKPIIGISTLDVVAAPQWQWDGPVCALLEAGRSELYAASYLFERMLDGDGRVTYQMKRLGDYLLASPQQVGLYLQEHASDWVGVAGERTFPSFLLCGEISPTAQQELHTQMQGRAFFLGAVQAVRQASVLALLALQRFHNGEADDPLMLEPLYLRRPSITTSTRKQPLLGGTAVNRPTGHEPAGPSNTEREEGALRH